MPGFRGARSVGHFDANDDWVTGEPYGSEWWRDPYYRELDRKYESKDRKTYPINQHKKNKKKGSSAKVPLTEFNLEWIVDKLSISQMRELIISLDDRIKEELKKSRTVDA